MHTTYRVDKNKDLMQNQSGTTAVALTSQPGSLSVSKHWKAMTHTSTTGKSVGTRKVCLCM